MPNLKLSPRFRSSFRRTPRVREPNRRPPRAAYALPTLFTAGNIFLGFLAIMSAFEGSFRLLAGHTDENPDWERAAIMIGLAVVLDGLDGRIARMTNTCSDFGREMDSLADCITFGIAPAVLAIAWGIQFMVMPNQGNISHEILRLGYFFAFTFLLCSAARLARFNVQTNPVPKNPGRPGRKYFVGLPTPAAAGLVASIIYAAEGKPLQWIGLTVLGVPAQYCWILSALWMSLLALLSFLLVSTWRYRSFKDLNLRQPLSPLFLVVCGISIYLFVNYSHLMLLFLLTVYVGSGIAIRVGGLLRRRVGIGGGSSSSGTTTPNLEPRPTS